MFVHTYLSELKFRDTVLPLTECCFRIFNFGRGGPNGLMSTRSSKGSPSPADFKFLMDTTEFIVVVATCYPYLHFTLITKLLTISVYFI
jgi:hypothetical protein